MKTIRNKMVVPIVLLVTISLIAVGGIASWLNYRSTFVTLEQTMTQTAKITSERVSHQLKEYANVAVETGSIARLSASTSSNDDKQEIIDQRVKNYDFTYGDILDTSGVSIFNGTDFSGKEFVEEALAGRYHVSEPFISDSGEIELYIAAPIWEKGVTDSTVVGAVCYRTTPSFLNDIVSTISISQNGAAYIIDDKGTTIAHKESKRVVEGENIFEVAKKNTGLAPLAAIHQDMVDGKTGFSTYKFGGVSKFVAFAPVTAAHGWSIAVNAPINDFMAETYASIIVVVVMLVVFILIGCAIAFWLSSAVSKPIKEIEEAAGKLASGDLTATINFKSKDELGRLSDSMRKLCATIIGLIKDMNGELNAMGNGDFTVESKARELFVGDFVALRNAVDNIKDKLNDTLHQINDASDQVASGSDQVSQGAQALSQGATEQASSIQELSATISIISEQIKHNASNAAEATVQSNSAGGMVTESNKQMEQMITAMGNISERSAEIGKIIKTIDDIAFQTNILALNAAVEAARAGAAGKGFAVVADEVRNLAGKSAEAAKNTTALIEETVRAVEEGTLIADSTAKAMLSVVAGAGNVARLIDAISQEAGEQAKSIAEVTIGVEQISSVIQTNSATAEESAAASEELSSQAQMLKSLVSQFNLKDLQ